MSGSETSKTPIPTVEIELVIYYSGQPITL